MSLDIQLTNKKTDEVVAEMNWLRNPFGLCNWAEDNIDNPKVKVLGTLHYVCNYWAYKEEYVDHGLFKAVVDKYNALVQALEKGYFFFNLPSYRQFIEGKLQHMQVEKLGIVGISTIVGSKYDERDRLAIPMWQFSHLDFHLGGEHSLDHYKAWPGQLVHFAELLQDPDNEFHCSN